MSDIAIYPYITYSPKIPLSGQIGCAYYSTYVEDTTHFILYCTKYTIIRTASCTNFLRSHFKVSKINIIIIYPSSIILTVTAISSSNYKIQFSFFHKAIECFWQYQRRHITTIISISYCNIAMMFLMPTCRDTVNHTNNSGQDKGRN